MTDPENSDYDAPEELTAEQGILQDQEMTRIKKENKARTELGFGVVREAKEERRKWAKRKTPLPAKGESVQNFVETESDKESPSSGGMLPNDIVQLLAARERKIFLSDSEDEKAETEPIRRKKKYNSSWKETVILKDISPPPCLHNSLEFLKKKKMQVPRSTSVLNNSKQALRLISTSGLLSKN